MLTFQVVEIDRKRVPGTVRDTVLVPPGRRVVVVFDYNNPGFWAFHCHLLYHRDAGMFTTFRYAYNYPLMVFAGMLPWTFFSTGLSEASNSLINNANLISKVYFPRLIVPTATVIVAFVDFLVTFLILILLMAWYQCPPGWQMLVLPAYTLLAFLASMGPALWITTLNVKYRDFRYVIPFIVQFGLYVSPVGFSSSVIPEKWRMLYSLNPMVGVIDGFRWCILRGQSPLYLPGLAASVCVAVSFLWLGIHRFRSMEKSFADLI
jgi:lipopolysaccharide transport system permease protein